MNNYYSYSDKMELTDSNKLNDLRWKGFNPSSYGNISLRNAFVEAGFDTRVSKPMIDQLVRVCTLFEVRGQHAEALNSALVGVYSCHFLKSDADSVFDVFGVNRTDFENVIKQYPGIPKEFKVASDEFNIFIVWMTHLIIKSNLPENIKKVGRITLFKMLHYKFYTSVINHNFPHGASPEVMQYVVDGLNAKFDIKNPDTPTWKLVIEKKSDELTSRSSIHWRTLETFVPDKRVTYVITDTQTRIRSTLINTVIQPYYKAKELNNKIGTYTNIQDINGERLIRDVAAIYDAMINGVCNQAVNINKFINNEYIKVVVAISTNISESMLRQLLVAFSNMAVVQISKGKTEETTIEGKEEVLIGYRAIVSNIIQKSYRDCIANKVDITSPLHIFEHVKNIYRSSRILDPDILLVKRSVDRFVNDSKVTTRDSTKASMKISFIIYILLLSFDYMK